jgi:hypothetical protein
VATLGCIAWFINGHYTLYGVGGAAAGSKEGADFVAAIADLEVGRLWLQGSGTVCTLYQGVAHHFCSYACPGTWFGSTCCAAATAATAIAAVVLCAHV